MGLSSYHGISKRSVSGWCISDDFYMVVSDLKEILFNKHLHNHTHQYTNNIIPTEEEIQGWLSIQVSSLVSA